LYLKKREKENKREKERTRERERERDAMTHNPFEIHTSNYLKTSQQAQLLSFHHFLTGATLGTKHLT
jgi:hypothetical protein